MAVVPYSSISELVDYLYDDERLHYEGMFDEDGALLEGDDPEDHIFTHVRRVAEWLDDEGAANAGDPVRGGPREAVK